MATGRWSYGLAGAVLAAGAAVLILHRDMATMEPSYIALLVAGTAGASFLVGLALSFLSGGGNAPGSEGRE